MIKLGDRKIASPIDDISMRKISPRDSGVLVRFANTKENLPERDFATGIDNITPGISEIESR